MLVMEMVSAEKDLTVSGGQLSNVDVGVGKIMAIAGATGAH